MGEALWTVHPAFWVFGVLGNRRSGYSTFWAIDWVAYQTFCISRSAPCAVRSTFWIVCRSRSQSRTSLAAAAAMEGFPRDQHRREGLFQPFCSFPSISVVLERRRGPVPSNWSGHVRHFARPCSGDLRSCRIRVPPALLRPRWRRFRAISVAGRDFFSRSAASPPALRIASGGELCKLRVAANAALRGRPRTQRFESLAQHLCRCIRVPPILPDRQRRDICRIRVAGRDFFV